MRTLILKSNRDEFEEFFITKMQLKNCKTVPYYKKITKNKLIRIIAIIWMQKLNIPFQSFWYGSWKKQLMDYDQIIVFDRHWGRRIFDYIHKKCPDKRLICWYWNTIDYKNKILPIKYRRFVEIWSFDEEDCKKYGFFHNIQFYFREKIDRKHIRQYDAVFVGKDKGRIKIIESINQTFKDLGLKTYIKVIRDNTSSNNESELYTEQEISYYDLREIIQKSECIIDVPQEKQYGITMRVLEALFLQKKLLTTNQAVELYDFYDTKKIYIWKFNNSENPKELKRFMDNRDIYYSEDNLDKYSFETWLKNFELNRGKL